MVGDNLQKAVSVYRRDCFLNLKKYLKNDTRNGTKIDSLMRGLRRGIVLDSVGTCSLLCNEGPSVFLVSHGCPPDCLDYP
jgi:hypothetical protein